MTAYKNFLTQFPNSINDAGLRHGITLADWRALGPNCQGVVRRQKGLVNTNRSDAGIYANAPTQGWGLFIPNPLYVPLDVSNVIRPRYAQPSLNDLGPIQKITVSGDYVVNVGNADGTKAAVEIDCSSGLVNIVGGNIVSAGNAFTIRGYSKVRIRNVRGWGLSPTVDGATHGKFVSAFRPREMTVEHCAIHKFGTMVLCQEPDDTALAGPLISQFNLQYDINGRLKNGNYPNEKSNGNQFDGQKSRKNQLIADNYINNYLPDTTAEDNLNVHNSSGTADSWFIIRDNLVDQSYGGSGSGVTTDGDGSKQADPATAAAYVEVFGNTFLGQRNGSMNNSGGHDTNYHHNVVINANLLPDGTVRPPGTYGYNSGLSISNSTNAPSTAFYNNFMRDNLLCVRHEYYHQPVDKRQDLASPAYGGQAYRNNIISPTENTHLLGDLPGNLPSAAMEEFYRQIHFQKWAQRGVEVGPQGQWR